MRGLAVLVALLAGCSAAPAIEPTPATEPIHEGIDDKPVLLEQGHVNYTRPDAQTTARTFAFSFDVPVGATRIDFSHDATVTGVGNGWVEAATPDDRHLREWEFCGNYAITPFANAAYTCDASFEGPAVAGNSTAGTWNLDYVHGLFTAAQAGTIRWEIWRDVADLESAE